MSKIKPTPKFQGPVCHCHFSSIHSNQCQQKWLLVTSSNRIYFEVGYLNHELGKRMFTWHSSSYWVGLTLHNFTFVYLEKQGGMIHLLAPEMVGGLSRVWHEPWSSNEVPFDLTCRIWSALGTPPFFEKCHNFCVTRRAEDLSRLYVQKTLFQQMSRGFAAREARLRISSKIVWFLIWKFNFTHPKC